MDPPRAGLTPPGTRGGEGKRMWDVVVRIIAVLIIVEGLVLVGRASGWLHDQHQ